MLKVQPQTEVTKSNHLHIRTKTKCNMCKLSLVVEMQKKKKESKCIGKKMYQGNSQSVLWVIEGPAHRQFSCMTERFHFLTL